MVKNPPANAGDERDKGFIPGSGRSRGEGNGNPLQLFLAWKSPQAEKPGRLQVHGVAKSQTQLSDCTTTVGSFNPKSISL